MTGEQEARQTRGVQGRLLIAVIALTSGVMLLEVVGGLVSGSLALISDAGHMLTDLLALVLSLMAIRVALRPATRGKTYGYHRVEILTALLNGTVLIVLSGLLLYKAAHRILHPAAVEGPLMLGVAVVGLLANLLALGLLSRCRQSLNIRGARMHVLGDTLSSFGVVLAGVVVTATGWTTIDPILGAAIAVVIVVGAFRLVREAVDVLLEGVPADIDPERVSEAIRTVPGVLEVHDLHIWSITTGLTALSGHVRVADGGATPRDQMLNHIKRTVRDRFGIVHTTIQLESPAYQELGDIH